MFFNSTLVTEPFLTESLFLNSIYRTIIITQALKKHTHTHHKTMPPLNENAPTTVPAISHRSNAQGNEQSNMNAKEETKHDSTQSQQQQQQQPASNSHDHHNAIMNALRRRGVNGKPKSSRYKRKYNSIDTTFKVNANIDASNSNDCLTPRRNNNANYQLSKNKRSHVVEQHYKIDRNRALLPGVPKYDVDLARDIHDFFNLICLVRPEFNVLIVS